MVPSSRVLFDAYLSAGSIPVLWAVVYRIKAVEDFSLFPEDVAVQDTPTG